MQFFKKYKAHILLAIIVVLGAFLRFYKLDWGNGLFTHPDEYHIVSSVNQLSFPDQMHPHFFSYGTVTIYLIYFTKEVIEYFSSITNHQSLTTNSFLLGRFYSALFSTLTIFLVYKISRTFLTTKLSLLAAFLVVLTPGLIQQAHFATPESTLIFFQFISLLFLTKFIKQNKTIHLIIASIFLGFTLGVKISSIVFLLPVVLLIILSAYFKRHSGLSRISNHFGDSGCAAAYQNDSERGHLGGGESIRLSAPPRWTLKLLQSIRLALASAIVTSATFALAAPYVFLDYPAFRSNLEYEGGLAIGKIPVFYTRQFIDTTPVLFQIEKIFPYALGPAVLVFGILGFFLIVVFLIKKVTPPRSPFGHLGGGSPSADGHDSSEVNSRSKIMLFIIIAFLSLFISNAFLFAKWTRFIAPTFPFFAIFAVFFLQELKRFRILFYSVSAILLLTTTLWTMAFFPIYSNDDIRITASKWLESTALPGSSFLVEGGNTVDLPLSGNFPKTSLHFYALEDDPLTRERIIDALYSSDYFLIQSRRVFYNHQRLPYLYPRTSRFYNALFDGQMGFEQIKEFHSYPKLEIRNWKLEIPDEGAEETWSVFDHPVIRVFKKIKQFSKEDYARLLEK